ncbi:MAG: hypothetical protein ISS93_00290 [Candidatus Aenigmarchaeota archaeon]|nr:hypothetical protein [Candidatus Aenigmarchaeota archaeon]
MLSSKICLLVLSLLPLIAISGCTSSGGGIGPGVVILSWEPELSQVYSNENVDLLVKVQNQGESRAKNVIAEITNIDLVEWGGLFQEQVQLGQLIPADEVSSTPGETKTSQFQNLRAPILSKGQSFDYQPTVRVSYDYRTVAQKPITIVDQIELVRIQQQGNTLPSKVTTYSSGPLTVEIVMGNYVKTSSRFGMGGETYDIFPVQIKITNNLWGSGGSVIPMGIGGMGGGFGTGQYDYPVLVKVTPPTGTNFIFSGYGDDCSSFQFTTELFKGKEAEVTCELEVTSPPTARSESLLQVELDYRYFVDSVTNLRVLGTKEAGTFGF